MGFCIGSKVIDLYVRKFIGNGWGYLKVGG